MNLLHRVMLYILWTRMKKWLWIPLIPIVLTLISSFGTYISKLSSSILVLAQDPVLSSLLGAIIGGVIALYGSVYVQRTQIRSEASLVKRDKIYEPLYNDLLTMRTTLKTGPSYYLVLNAQELHYHNLPAPVFVEWPALKTNSRNLQVPKKLAQALNMFEQSINGYIKLWQSIIQSEILIHDFRLIASEIPNINHQIMISNYYHFLTDENDYEKVFTNVEHLFRTISGTQLIPVLDHNQIIDVIQRVNNAFSHYGEVVNLQTLHILIDSELQELINVLELLIRFINEELEQHEQWF